MQHSSKEDFPRWIIHSGGVRILKDISSLLTLKEEQCLWSYEILSEIGNMSSAAVQFVMECFMKSGKSERGRKVLMVGIGPGLTVELIAFECE